MKEKHVHVSFDIVDEFIPRVPENRCEGEDDTVKRICVAPDIFHAINAMPRGGESMWKMHELGIPLFFHAYYLEAESEDIIRNEKLFTLIPDAIFTKEAWIIGKPKAVRRIDYILEEPIFREIYSNDDLLHEVIGGKLKRTKKDNSWERFFLWMNGNRKVPKGINIPFSLFIGNLDDEIREIIIKKIQKNDLV